MNTAWFETRRVANKKRCASAGRPWAENSAEFAGFLTLWPIKKRTDSPRKACRYRGVTAPLSCCFGGHGGSAVLGVARVGPHQDAQGFSRRKTGNRKSQNAAKQTPAFIEGVRIIRA